MGRSQTEGIFDMGFRNAAKKDGNQTQIVRELRAMYFQVDIVHRLKKLYDLVVTGKDSEGEVRTLRVEIKMPNEKLTVDEQEYHDRNMYPETLLIAYKTEDILEWFGRI